MHALLTRGGPIEGFHQSMLIAVPEGLSEAALVAGFQALLDTHDALRMRLEHYASGSGRLHIAPPGTVSAAACVQRVTLGALNETAQHARLQAEAQDAQSRLSPQAGCMVQAVWIVDMGRLLLLIHHLAVDGVSWRIIVPDLLLAWQAAMQDEPVMLEAVGTPFRVWAQHLLGAAPSRLAELETWETIAAGAGPLVPGRRLDPQRDTVSRAGHLQVELPVALTQALVTTVASAFYAGMNEVLLSALVLSVARWQRQRFGLTEHAIGVDLEGHGREPLAEGLEVSRTVGWFTTRYPLRLDAGGVSLDEAFTGGSALGTALKRIKEQVRSVPNRGVGYGVLRYLHAEAGERLAQFATPQVGFNYLGRFVQDEIAAGLSGGASEAMALAHVVEINAMTLETPEGVKLVATWSWTPSLLSASEVEALSQGWQQALEAMVQHVSQPGVGGHTPSDFALVSLSQAQVDRIESLAGEVEAIWPLSPLQQGLLFHALYDDSGPDVYTVQVGLEVEGTLEPERLRQAIEALMARHSVLRARVMHEGLAEPVQVIVSEVEVPWREMDLSPLAPGEQSARLEAVLAAEHAERFMLSEGPLLRWLLVRLDKARHLMVMTKHHMLLDGWSMPIVWRELLTLYDRGIEARGLRPVRPYSDYLSWLAAQDEPAALEVWRQYLHGVSEPTLLADASVHGVKSVPEDMEVSLSPSLTRSLEDWSRELGVTLNTVVQGLWAVLLGRFMGRDDVVFGVTVSGRPASLSGVEGMVGLFINTVPLRVKLVAGQTVASLCRELQTRQSTLLGVEHVGLSTIQQVCGQGELFDTLMVFENYPAAAPREKASGEELRVVGARHQDGTHYALSLVVVPGERLHLRMIYDSSRIARERVELIRKCFEQLLTSAVSTPEVPVHALELLSAHERTQVLEDFNATAHAVPEVTLVEFFEAQVARTPEAPAVIMDETTVSYAELNAQANCLAHVLIDLSVGPESLVGVCLERSVELVAALLGILKAGGAYVPLDPAYPQARLAYILTDANPALTLSSVSLRDCLPEATRLVVLDTADIRTTLAQAPDHNPTNYERYQPLLPAHPAYVIYTSGSTGQPKGVTLTHQGIPSLGTTSAARLEITPHSRVLQFASLNFDASLW
nr:condensation domain-containing protein [Candidatus Entotheonella palauensis]